MTSMTPMTRTATTLQRDLDDADMIRVTEMWASRQH